MTVVGVVSVALVDADLIGESLVGRRQLVHNAGVERLGLGSGSPLERTAYGDNTEDLRVGFRDDLLDVVGLEDGVGVRHFRLAGDCFLDRLAGKEHGNGKEHREHSDDDRCRAGKIVQRIMGDPLKALK